MRDPLGDLHGQRPDPVRPVVHPRGGHRIGDQRDSIHTGAADHVAVQRAVHMHPVGDEFDGHPRILQ